MSHDSLAVKLCQLDDRLERLCSRIRVSGAADHPRLQQEIAALTWEWELDDAALQNSLHRSKAAVAGVLAKSYEQVEAALGAAADRLAALEAQRPDARAVVEDKMLLAEYALDLAQQAAGQALLVALRAMDAELLLEKEENTEQ